MDRSRLSSSTQYREADQLSMRFLFAMPAYAPSFGFLIRQEATLLYSRPFLRFSSLSCPCFEWMPASAYFRSSLLCAHISFLLLRREFQVLIAYASSRREALFSHSLWCAAFLEAVTPCFRRRLWCRDVSSSFLDSFLFMKLELFLLLMISSDSWDCHVIFFSLSFSVIAFFRQVMLLPCH